MDYLDDFGTFNPKTKEDAKSYVLNNFYALKQLMNLSDDEYESEEEMKDYLIEYFTRFPDQISRISFSTFGVPKNYVPRLNNIGGVIKYR